LDINGSWCWIIGCRKEIKIMAVGRDKVMRKELMEGWVKICMDSSVSVGVG